MKNIRRKIGIGLLILILLLGAAIVASNIYYRSMSHQALAEATTAKAWVGIPNQEADVTIVAFVDYADPVTYKIYNIMEEALRQDLHAQVLIRPIAGTKETFQVALYMDAAAHTDITKAQILHSQVLSMSPPPDLRDIMVLAEQLGFDNNKLQELAKTKEISSYAANDYKLFRKIGFHQPPAFVIGRKGYIPNRERIAGVNAWLMMLQDARKLAHEQKSQK